jgi:hypothetical protein
LSANRKLSRNEVLGVPTWSACGWRYNFFNNTSVRSSAEEPDEEEDEEEKNDNDNDNAGDDDEGYSE